MDGSDKPYAKANEAMQKAIRESQPMMAMAGKLSSKSLLLEHAERLRRQAHQLEGLAYAIEHISGDAESTLYGLLSGEMYRT